MCKITEETQHYNLEECQGLHQDDSTKVTKTDLFNEKIQNLAEVPNKIIITMNTREQT